MKKLMSILVALVIVGLAAPGFAEYLPGNTEQRDVVDSRDMLVDFLDGRGYVASRLELRKYSPNVVEDLASVAKDASLSTTVRERAVDCLALYRSKTTARKTVRGLLQSESQGSDLFDNAILALGQLEGERSVSTLKQFVDASDERVRTTVVVALGRFGGQAGFGLLKERAQVEDNEQVLSHINRYVQ